MRWMNDLVVLPLASSARGNRFDHMVRRFSGEADLILRLRRYGIDRVGAERLLATVAERAAIECPEASFHRGRGAHTGYCLPPRRVVGEQVDEGWLEEWEAVNARMWPERGMIRLGEPTALGTLAHEFGHHMVHVLDPTATPAHGKRWVERYDFAALSIASLMGRRLAGR